MISIIISTLNEEECITKTLKCLQDFRKKKLIEIILVDVMSTDNTLNISKKFCDKITTTNPGRANQFNTGVVLAKYDLLLFLHADTIINNENIYEILKEYLRIEWGFYQLKFNSDANKYRFLSYCINLRSKLFRYGTGDQCIFVKKKLFLRVNGFDRLNLMEDIELSDKLLKIVSPIIMKSAVCTSARKWIKDGYVKTIIKMRIIRFLYYLGIDTKYLEKMY